MPMLNSAGTLAGDGWLRPPANTQAAARHAPVHFVIVVSNVIEVILWVWAV